jgi:FkbM family methyltransferase
MSNDPRDHNGQKLFKALVLIKEDKLAANLLSNFLVDLEERLIYDGSVREEITGPIIDAIHDSNDIFEKRLADGTLFKFLYRTKIARDFLFSKYETPTHVWEPQTTKLLNFLISKTNGDILIGGAYFGDHAVLAGNWLKNSTRKIHCFEPNLDQSKMLIENFKINDIANYSLKNLGLWSESGLNLKLDGFDSFANAVVCDDDDGFATISIDDYFASTKRALGVLMLDIEGAEYKALLGASKILMRDRPMIIFEVHRDYVNWDNGLQNTEICKLLLGYGYHVYAVRDINTNKEMYDLPVELIPLDQVYLDGPNHGFNMVAVLDPGIFLGEKFKFVNSVSPKLLVHRDAKFFHPTDGFVD